MRKLSGSHRYYHVTANRNDPGYSGGVTPTGKSPAKAINSHGEYLFL